MGLIAMVDGMPTRTHSLEDEASLSSASYFVVAEEVSSSMPARAASDLWFRSRGDFSAAIIGTSLTKHGAGAVDGHRGSRTDADDMELNAKGEIPSSHPADTVRPCGRDVR
jgi:hypothetical protein